MIVKAAGLPVLVSIRQLTSLLKPAGRRSLSVTPVAAAAPSLVIVTVKPTLAPALTVA